MWCRIKSLSKEIRTNTYQTSKSTFLKNKKVIDLNSKTIFWYQVLNSSLFPVANLARLMSQPTKLIFRLYKDFARISTCNRMFVNSLTAPFHFLYPSVQPNGPFRLPRWRDVFLGLIYRSDANSALTCRPRRESLITERSFGHREHQRLQRRARLTTTHYSGCGETPRIIHSDCIRSGDLPPSTMPHYCFQDLRPPRP